jgi:hypothetical protein
MMMPPKRRVRRRKPVPEQDWELNNFIVLFIYYLLVLLKSDILTFQVAVLRPGLPGRLKHGKNELNDLKKP